MNQVFLFDIEGTITDINFVKNILFPYAAKNLAAYIQAHIDDQKIQDIWQESNLLVGKELSVSEWIEQLQEWIALDQKVTPLKTLQGLIWQQGYAQGDFKGHLYQDAYDFLHQNHLKEQPMAIYSSGSVQAQKLLLHYSIFGDLTNYFKGFFDTNIGGKLEQISYIKIAETLKIPANQMTFFSDHSGELDAAKAAGYQTIQLHRADGAASPLSQNHSAIANFQEFSL